MAAAIFIRSLLPALASASQAGYGAGARRSSKSTGSGSGSKKSELQIWIMGEIYKKILQKIKHANSILDVGCGEGELTAFLAQHKKRITGVDISSSGFRKAKEMAAKKGVSNMIKCTKGDVHKLSRLTEEKFDAVTLAYTLHELAKPEAALKEIRKVLKPSSTVLIVECIAAKEEDRHPCCNFTIDDIKDMLRKTCFKCSGVEKLDKYDVLISAAKL